MTEAKTVKNQWPHSPPHWAEGAGNYIVTAATLDKKPHFRQPEMLSMLQDTLLVLAKKYAWKLHVWAIFPNHYHFVGYSKNASNLKSLMRHVHSSSARDLNKYDGTTGRRVWHNYWETKITNERSWYARLRYVNENAVKHGIVTSASLYPYCSAGWLELKASSAFLKTLSTFGISRVSVLDDY